MKLLSKLQQVQRLDEGTEKGAIRPQVPIEIDDAVSDTLSACFRHITPWELLSQSEIDVLYQHNTSARSLSRANYVFLKVGVAKIRSIFVGLAVVVQVPRGQTLQQDSKNKPLLFQLAVYESDPPTKTISQFELKKISSALNTGFLIYPYTFDGVREAAQALRKKIVYLCKTQLSAKADLEQVIKPLLPLDGIVRRNQKKRIYVDIPYTLSRKVRWLPLNTVEIPLTAYVPSSKPVNALIKLSRSQSPGSSAAWLKTEVACSEIPLAYHRSVIFDPPMSFLTYKRRRVGSAQDYVDFLKDSSRDFIGKLSAFVGYGDTGSEFELKFGLSKPDLILSGIVDTGIVVIDTISESIYDQLLKYLDKLGLPYQVGPNKKITLFPIKEDFKILKSNDNTTTLNKIVLRRLRESVAVLLKNFNIKLEFY